MLALEVLEILTRIDEASAHYDLIMSSVYPNAIHYKTTNSEFLMKTKIEKMDYQSHVKLCIGSESAIKKRLERAAEGH